MPSVAPSLGTGHGSTSGVTSTTSPTAPGTTHDSSQGDTDGPLDPPRQLLGNSTMEPPSQPIPTQGPTDHIVWHTSILTQETTLNSTRLRNEDLGPSPFPDLPLIPTPVSLKPPDCGESSWGHGS